MSNMSEVARILGVELDQKFCLKKTDNTYVRDLISNGYGISVFSVNEARGLCRHSFNGETYNMNSILSDILRERYTIVPYENGCERPVYNSKLRDVLEVLEDIVDSLNEYNDAWVELNKNYYTQNEDMSKIKALKESLCELKEHVIRVSQDEILNRYRSEEGVGSNGSANH